MSKAVLITTATAPPDGVPFLQMTNVAARYVTAKAAAFFWAAQGIEKMIIADATGSRLMSDEEVMLLKDMNVEVEQIQYQQNQDLIKRRGKGYGEGLLLQFALEHSVLLQSERSFFKCTGKIYCRNFEAIQQLVEHNDIAHIFWKHQEAGTQTKPWADMRFFYSTKEFCNNHLIPAYLKTNDRALEVAEQFCFEALSENLALAKTIRPLLSGFAGWTGKLYPESSVNEQDDGYACWITPPHANSA